MKSKIDYRETDYFNRGFKKLSKKFKTLSDDFTIAKKNAIELLHLQNIDNQSIVLIPGYEHKKIRIYKLRKFACRSLKGRGVVSGIRIIYAYHIELRLITFIEIYFKPDQENEHRKKIEDFLELME